MVNLDDGEAAFIAARVRRLCKTFGYPVPDAKDDEFVVRVSGSLIGGLLTDVEARKPAAWMNEKRDMTYLGHYNAGDIPLYTEHLPDPAGTNTFQPRVKPWLIACFGAEIAGDRAERNHRFLEESLELVQSLGCTAGHAHQLVDYVFGRPVGEPHQEAGGVMTTLAALCLANGLDMHIAGEDELARIWTKVEQIRAKQAAKPEGSPLAEAMPARQVGAPAALGAPYATDVVEDVRDTFNRVIDHAVDLSLEADQFLRCWREGDWAGCREFGFEADHAKEQSAEAGD